MIFDFNIGPEGDIDKDEMFVSLNTSKGLTRYLYSNIVSDTGSVEVDPHFGLGLTEFIGKFVHSEMRDEIKSKIENLLKNVKFLNMQGFSVSVRIAGDKGAPIIFIILTAVTGERYIFEVRYDLMRITIKNDKEEVSTEYDVIDDNLLGIVYDHVGDAILNRL